MYRVPDQVGKYLAQPAMVGANHEVVWNLHPNRGTLACERLRDILDERREHEVGGLESPDSLLDAADIQQIPGQCGDRVDICERTFHTFDVTRASFAARVAQREFEPPAQRGKEVPKIVSQDGDQLFGRQTPSLLKRRLGRSRTQLRPVREGAYPVGNRPEKLQVGCIERAFAHARRP